MKIYVAKKVVVGFDTLLDSYIIDVVVREIKIPWNISKQFYAHDKNADLLFFSVNSKDEIKEVIEKFFPSVDRIIVNDGGEMKICCKNCKHFREGDCRIYQCAKGQVVLYEIEPEKFFCSFYEEKEENE